MITIRLSYKRNKKGAFYEKLYIAHCTIIDNAILPVDKILCLLACTDQLNNSVKHLCTIGLLLLFKHKHEVVTEARLHHDPVNCTGQVDVSGEENNIFTCIRTPTHTNRISHYN